LKRFREETKRTDTPDRKNVDLSESLSVTLAAPTDNQK